MSERFPSNPAPDGEKETSLKETLLSRLPSASTIEDLARVMKDALDLDVITGDFDEVDKAITSRFKRILADKVHDLGA